MIVIVHNNKKTNGI
uniref:Uncharacterized protein n=1 Tax=Anguilla anguilla TaxID=7936 RepID=A0A0E9W1E6_ANGAN